MLSENQIVVRVDKEIYELRANHFCILHDFAFRNDF